MIGHNRPSKKVDEIYNILEKYETGEVDLYHHDVLEAIQEHLISTGYDNKFQMCCSSCTCSLAIIDNGYPFLIVFDYI